MDKGEYENELKQVLGDTRAAYDISEHDTLVFGEHGILVAGPNSRHHEPLLVAFMQVRGAVVGTEETGALLPLVAPPCTHLPLHPPPCPLQFSAMDIFVRNFFSRMFLVQDDMKAVRGPALLSPHALPASLTDCCGARRRAL